MGGERDLVIVVEGKTALSICVNILHVSLSLSAYFTYLLMFCKLAFVCYSNCLVLPWYWLHKMYTSDIQIFDFHLRWALWGSIKSCPPYPPPHISGVIEGGIGGGLNTTIGKYLACIVGSFDGTRAKIGAKTSSGAVETINGTTCNWLVTTIKSQIH